MESNNTTKEKDFSIASLICGLLIWIPLLNMALGPLALILGIISINKIKNQPEKYTGQGMAIAGIILGSISTASLLLYFYYMLFNPAAIQVQ